DTWVWQNNAWTPRSPSTVPPERSNQAMAFHAGTGMTVLFGGSQLFDLPSFALGDTWLWNGTNWTQVFPLNSPSPRTDVTMAYDPAHDVIVLFGGIDASGTTLNDTWLWNGVNWLLQNPGTVPPARSEASMSTHTAGHNVVLFGGITDPCSCGQVLNDTWTWNGSDWTQQNPVTAPPARTWAGMADSQATGFAVLFGGFDSDGFGLGDTWLWSGSTWMQQIPSSSPSPRGLLAMGSDRQGLQVLLFGGVTDCGCFPGDTWTWEPAAAAPPVVTSVSPSN